MAPAKPQTFSSGVTPDQFKTMVKWASENPNTPQAQEFQRRTQSGRYNDILTALNVPLDKFVTQPAKPSQPTESTDEHKNFLQKALEFTPLPAVAKSAMKAGRAVGDLALTGINAVSGGALDKYTPEGNLSSALQRAQNVETPIPVFGDKTKAAKDITAENTLGEAANTVAWTGGPVAAGALMLGGSAAEKDASGVSVIAHTIAGAIGGKVLQYGFDKVAPLAIKAAEKYGAPFVESLSKLIPQEYKVAFDMAMSKVPNLPSLPSASEIKILPESVSSKLQAAGDKVESMANKPFEAASDLAGKAKEKVAKVIEGKTEQEIMSTPPSQLHKLSAPDRKFYFDQKAQQVNEAAENLSNTRKEQLSNKLEASQKEAEAIKRQVDVASRDEAINLRPKAIQAFGKQSQIYRDLVDTELADSKYVQVSHDDLGKFIDTRFPENPELANAVKGRFGLEDGKMTTLGNIYEKTKALGQDISAAGKKGTRVYTPDEKLTDDAISTLVDFMKNNGVDLSKARQFWARYAPIRNEINSKLKPFNTAGTETGTFAQTLTRVASGKDVNNENFIAQTEKLLGQKIGGKTKQFIQQLSDNEKKTLAAKIEHEAAMASDAVMKNQALKDLSAEEREVARKAKVRKAIEYVIGAAAAHFGNQQLKKATGFGLPLI